MSSIIFVNCGSVCTRSFIVIIESPVSANVMFGDCAATAMAIATKTHATTHLGTDFIERSGLYGIRRRITKLAGRRDPFRYTGSPGDGKSRRRRHLRAPRA